MAQLRQVRSCPESLLRGVLLSRTFRGPAVGEHDVKDSRVDSSNVDRSSRFTGSTLPTSFRC